MTLLKIDVDRGRPLQVRTLVALAKRAGKRIVALSQARSPSGRGWHLALWVWPVPRSAVETVALQLLFGSDPYREAYNLNRARRVDAKQVPPYWRRAGNWNVLYGRA